MMMKIGNRFFDVEHDCSIMGILNVTPDSFSDGGRWNNLDDARRHTADMIAEGAAIVGITQYPYLYDPSRQGTLDSGKTFREKNKERQETVLDKMHELGYLDDAEY